METSLREGDRFPVDALAERGGAPTAGGPLVVYFYPQAGSPTCTREAVEFNRLHGDFRAAGVELVGVSVDPAEELSRFCSNEGLAFTLVSDPGGELTSRLGLMKTYDGHGDMAARVTFLVDADGVIRRIWQVTDVESHAHDVLTAARELA